MFDKSLHAIDELAHDLGAAGEGDQWNGSKRQLNAHQNVQDVVEAGQAFDGGEEGHTKSGNDGDTSGEQHSLPFGPMQVEEALHHELTSICTWNRSGFKWPLWVESTTTFKLMMTGHLLRGRSELF